MNRITLKGMFISCAVGLAIAGIAVLLSLMMRL